MALQVALSFRGLTAPNAYHRIVSISLLVDPKVIEVRYGSWTTIAEYQAGTQPLQYGVGTFKAADFDSFVNTNAKPLTIAYGALKTLPEFAGAIDV